MADKERAIAILQDEVQQHPNGYELYFDYDDKISSETIAEAFGKYTDMVQETKGKGAEPDYPTFAAFLEDTVYEKWELWAAIDDQTREDFEYGRTAEEIDIVNEYLEEEGISLGEALDAEGFAGVSWNLSDIIGEHHMNLMFATPNERNTDMGSIHDMFGDVQELNDYLQREGGDGHFDNALSYLVHQQGYKVSQVAEVFYTGEPTTDTFLQSVVNELDDYATSWCMLELTALVTLDADGLAALDKIAKGEGTIELSKDTMLGIFNEWEGAGGSLEIELNKPFVVPADMIRNVQIEGQESNAIKGYTVDDVYGLVGSCWKGKAEVTDKDSDREQIEASMKEDVSATLDIIERKAAEAEKECDIEM